MCQLSSDHPQTRNAFPSSDHVTANGNCSKPSGGDSMLLLQHPFPCSATGCNPWSGQIQPCRPVHPSAGCHTVPRAEAWLGPACPCTTARASTVIWKNRTTPWPSGPREWQGQEPSSGQRLQHSMATLMLGETCCYVHQVL